MRAELLQMAAGFLGAVTVVAAAGAVVTVVMPHWTDNLFRLVPEDTAACPARAVTEREPVELLAGPLCGTPILIPPAFQRVELLVPTTGESVAYERTDLKSRKGCRVFRLEREKQPSASQA